MNIETKQKKQYKQYGISPEPPEVKPNGRYTTGEAAQKLNLNRNTITNAFKAGTLHAIDPCARRLRYSGRELQRFWNWKTSQ